MTDILKARDRLKASGARVLGDGEPRIGAHGKPVLFLHPKDFNGSAGRARAGIGDMSVTFGVAIYLVIWWTVLFAVLPIGVRTQGEDGVIVPGTPESAPTAPRLLRVVVLTTAISALVFAALWVLVAYGVIDLNALLGRPS